MECQGDDLGEKSESVLAPVGKSTDSLPQTRRASATVDASLQREFLSWESAGKCPFSTMALDFATSRVSLEASRSMLFYTGIRKEFAGTIALCNGFELVIHDAYSL